MTPIKVTQEQYDRLQNHLKESTKRGENRNRRIKTSMEMVTRVKTLSKQGVPHCQITKKLHIGHTTLIKILRGHYD